MEEDGGGWRRMELTDGLLCGRDEEVEKFKGINKYGIARLTGSQAHRESSPLMTPNEKADVLLN